MRIQAAFLQQFLVRPLFFQLPAVQNEDDICVPDGIEAVRDHQDGLTLQQSCHALPQRQLIFRVRKGHRFIQHDDGGVFQHRPCNGDALRLPAG